MGQGGRAAQNVPDGGAHARIFGYAGPATGVFSKYIVTDMYAKAGQGTSAEDAVRWAESELRKICEA